MIAEADTLLTVRRKISQKLSYDGAKLVIIQSMQFTKLLSRKPFTDSIRSRDHKTTAIRAEARLLDLIAIYIDKQFGE